MNPIYNSVVFLFLIVIVCATGETRVLRRRRGRPGDVSPHVDLSTCRVGPDNEFMMMMVGERTSDNGGGDFIVPSPGLSMHREVLGYTDADIVQLYADAEAFFLEFAGIDFSGAELNAETGVKMIEGWMLMPIEVNVGHRIIYTSEAGHLDCPLKFHDESLTVVSTQPGVYKGSFGMMWGGESPAEAGETLSYGHYAFDFNGDGEYSPLKYYSATPGRTILKLTRLDYWVESAQWGLGRMDGMLDSLSFAPNGQPHVGLRSSFTFPARSNFVLPVV